MTEKATQPQLTGFEQAEGYYLDGLDGTMRQEYFSLNELLGDDWKDKCIFPNFEKASNFESIDSGVKLTGQYKGRDRKSEFKRFIVSMDKVFERSNKNGSVRFIDSAFDIAIFSSRIGGSDDRFYSILYESFIPDFSYDDSSRMYVFTSSSLGLVSADGRVFSLDRLFKDCIRKEKDFTFHLYEGSCDESVCGVQSGRSKDGKLEFRCSAHFPSSYNDVLGLFHEAGHMIRDLSMSGDFLDGMEESSKLDSFVKEELSDDEKLKFRDMSKRQRTEERGSWAIGLSLLMEIGKEIGLDIASDGYREQLQSFVDLCLSSHEARQEMNPGFEIPFTQSSRGKARRLEEFDRL